MTSNVLIQSGGPAQTKLAIPDSHELPPLLQRVDSAATSLGQGVSPDGFKLKRDVVQLVETDDEFDDIQSTSSDEPEFLDCLDPDEFETASSPDSEQQAPRINWKNFKECTVEEFNQGFLDVFGAIAENPDLQPENFKPGPADPKDATLEQAATRANILMKILVSNMPEWKQKLFLQTWPLVYLLIVNQLPDSLNEDEKSGIAQIMIVGILAKIEGLPGKFVPLIPENFSKTAEAAYKKSEPAIQELLHEATRSQAITLAPRKNERGQAHISQTSSSGSNWAGYLFTAAKTMAAGAVILYLIGQFPVVGAEQILNATSTAVVPLGYDFGASTAVVSTNALQGMGSFCPAFVTDFIYGLLGSGVNTTSTALVTYGAQQSLSGGMCHAIMENFSEIASYALGGMSSLFLGSARESLVNGASTALVLAGSRSFPGNTFPALSGNLISPSVFQNLTNSANISGGINLGPNAGTEASWSLMNALGYVPTMLGMANGAVGLVRAVGNRDFSLRRLAPPLLSLTAPLLTYGALNPSSFLPSNIASMVEQIPGPLRTIAAAIIPAIFSKAISAPEKVVEDVPKKFHAYEQQGRRTKKGTFNIKVMGPAGLSKDDQEALFAAFVRDRIEACPLKTMVGDTLEFSSSDSKSWNVRLEPKDPDRYVGRELEHTETFTTSPSERSKIARNEIFHEVSVLGNNSSFFLAALRGTATKTRDLPLTAASRVPVGFKNGNPQMQAAMQMLASNPALLAAMQRSKHEKLKTVALQYAQKMQQTADSDPIDLNPLLEELKPFFLKRWLGFTNLADTQPHQVNDYVDALSRLIMENDPAPSLGGAFTAKLSIPKSGYQPSDWDAKWTQVQKSHNNREIGITVNNANAVEGFQKRFTDVLANGDPSSVDEAGPWTGVGANEEKKTQFHHVPSFLPIRLHRDPGAEIEVPIDLVMDKTNIRGLNSQADRIRYRLESFIAGETVYRRTTEIVYDRRVDFFWKITPQANGGHAEAIDKDAFLSAAKQSATQLLYSQNETSAPLNVRHADYNPQVLETDVAGSKMRLLSDPGLLASGRIPSQTDLDTLHDPDTLRDAVKAALNTAPGNPVTLQVLGTNEGYNPMWALGVMWYIVQEYLRGNPGKDVQLGLPDGIDRDKALKAVQGIDSNANDLATFETAWSVDYPQALPDEDEEP